MPFCVGPYEMALLKRGFVVATHPGRSWTCACGGALLLTRRIDGSGLATPAKFLCNKCGKEMQVYPDMGGGVRPAKVEFRVNTETAYGKDPGDGRWR